MYYSIHLIDEDFIIIEESFVLRTTYYFFLPSIIAHKLTILFFAFQIPMKRTRLLPSTIYGTIVASPLHCHIIGVTSGPGPLPVSLGR